VAPLLMTMLPQTAMGLLLARQIVFAVMTPLTQLALFVVNDKSAI